MLCLEQLLVAHVSGNGAIVVAAVDQNDVGLVGSPSELPIASDLLAGVPGDAGIDKLDLAPTAEVILHVFSEQLTEGLTIRLETEANRR